MTTLTGYLAKRGNLIQSVATSGYRQANQAVSEVIVNALYKRDMRIHRLEAELRSRTIEVYALKGKLRDLNNRKSHDRSHTGERNDAKELHEANQQQTQADSR